ncbi:hypothetical protein KEM54_001610 [Ascosphaera aggregata]|nr:hypothetical protein KEM54_001610 [Ascosphaera aggregata]
MGLARKLLITVADDGLVIQNATGCCRNVGDEVSSLHIEYESCSIQRRFTAGSVSRQGAPSLESHGLAGLISLASYSFIVAITGRKQVAQIHGKPVFVVTDVTLIPLSSEEEASKAIATAGELQKERKQSDSDVSSISSGSDASQGGQIDDIADPDEGVQPVNDSSSGRTSVAGDVIERQGRYGRFAARWFSKNGWTTRNTFFQGITDSQGIGLKWGSKRRPNGKGLHKDKDAMEMDGLTPDGQISEPSSRASEDDSNRIEARAREVLPKLLKYAKILLSSDNFFFSYDYDITRKYTVHNPVVETIPLYRRADPEFFWNRHLMQPFIESGQHDLVLPLIQGFIGQHEFVAQRDVKTQESETMAMPATIVNDASPSDEDFPAQVGAIPPNELHRSRGTNLLVTLISRRSIKRPGVRYLRRGVDDDGNVANTVETEQILSTPSWNNKDRIYSLLQVRGSIPLYFSQSPYSLKPAPVLRHSNQTNRASFDRHMNALSEKYGKIQVVSLIDRHGVEIKIGERYQDFAKEFNGSGQTLAGNPLAFTWFDFHHECRGLKFENVSCLVKSLEFTLDDFGYTVIQDGAIIQRQSGIVRTNCMDCLDRTGVAQCAFGQYALTKQLRAEGYAIDLLHDDQTQWFNILWADNGDAISKQYSSTAALKGDYTRTRKRNVRGALNDLGLTLSRYYNNLVNDYFSQACMDYMLGNVTIHVFDEFESDLMSGDPGISLEKIRQTAIESCRDIVLSDDSEELLGGWTLLSPRELNTLRTLPFEESVLLLTDAAIYCCRFDWDAEKLLGFERIELCSIVKMVHGTYITSTLTEIQMDSRYNVGFVVSYKSSGDNYLRINTRSPRTLVDCGESEGGIGQGPDLTAKVSQDGQSKEKEWDIFSFFRDEKREVTRLAAFKVLPFFKMYVRKDSYTPPVKERDTARLICEEIEHAMMKICDNAAKRSVGEESLIKEMEIISVSEARKQTGILEHLAYDLKRLVWA